MTLFRAQCIWIVKIVVVLLGVNALPRPAASQGNLVDSAVLLVSRGPRVIGREEFELRRGQQSEAGAGFVGAGFTVTATAYYPPSRSYASAASVVTFHADSQPASARMDLDGSGQPNTFVDFTARRITVRNRTSAGESAGQYPRRDRVFLLDDSMLSLFALLPGIRAGVVNLFYPRTGRSDQAPLADHGMEYTSIDDEDRQLRHITLECSSQTWHLWYDSRGRLIKVYEPSEDLTAIRTSLR